MDIPNCENCGGQCILFMPAYWGFHRMGDRDYATLSCEKCGWSKDIDHGKFPKTKEYKRQDIKMDIPEGFADDFIQKLNNYIEKALRGKND